jgi:hypothetical protein
MDGLEVVAKKLADGGIVGELWLNGSFLTQKIDPADVDLVLRISLDFCDKATEAQSELLNWLVNEDLKRLHHCDSYLWVEFPAGHPLYWEGEWKRSYWIRQFGFSRAQEMKGMALVKLPEGAV